MAYTRSCESQIKLCEPDLTYRSLAKFKGIYECQDSFQILGDGWNITIAFPSFDD